MASENLEKFARELENAVKAGNFVKLTLGNYRGTDPHLQKLLVRLIKTGKGVRFFFLYRHDTRDTAKNYDLPAGLGMLGELLGYEFFSGHLFTTENDFQLEIGKRGKSRLNVGKPTFKATPDLSHDRSKRDRLNPDRFYLKALGITTDEGAVRIRQHDKWRQINKFIEILSNLIDNSLLRNQNKIRIADMGSGKGYLTFAAFDYFKNIRKIDVEMTGIDTREELVRLCTDIARASDFAELRFVHGSIGEFDLRDTDILIALHACNTATDDAIYKGIKAGAALIVCAPCCHHELRPQIKAPEMLRNVLKHGVMLEREAETLTDGLRSLLLEKSGYSTKLFEFVSTEHTPKNNMIVGTRHQNRIRTEELSTQIDSIKEFYGIKEQRLEALLAAAEDDKQGPDIA